MKSYVAVQKKSLIVIYHIWKKNERFEPNYQKSIQEKEQKFFSLSAFEKGIKNSPNKIKTAQGKHPVNNHSKFPLF